MLTPENAQRLLTLDSAGGLIAGTLVIALHQPLSQWEDLPPALLLVTGAANILYGLYSGRLAYLARCDHPLHPTALRFLVAANAFWTLVCLILTALFWSRATVWGVVHLVGEGIYVGVLAWVESRVFFAKIET